MREAAAGQHNGKYTDWANKILASRAGEGDPIYVRTTWELGGEWFPWTAAAKEDPQAYIKAFQQFAASFHDVSPRFKIVWDFVPDRGPVEQWYPGDEAVDVISQDVYWHTQYSGTDPVAAFDRAVNGMSRGLAWVADFAAQHGKPIAISEWGVPGDGHDGAKYIELMQAWIESHDVAYADYWNSTAAYDGLLSDGGPSATAARLKQMLLEGIEGGGTVPPPAPGPASAPAPPPAAPASPTVGSGPDILVLKISQDAFGGDAQYTVAVDGKQIGGTLTAKASHAAGQSDTVTVQGDWAAGAHDAVVTFLNDDWGGTAATDRNLHVDGAAYNGAAVPGAARALMGNGGAGFSFTDAGAAAASLDLQGTAGADSLAGGAGADRLRGLDGGDTLAGGAGGDALNGGAGADALDGGAGNDYLLGGQGADTLTGGAGPDRFAFLNAGEGGDTVLDFDAAGGDRLDLRGAFAAAAGQSYAGLSAGGFVEAAATSGGVLVSVDADGGGDGYAALATLQGLTLATLGTDFLVA
jgi:Ca2+-binding RTX toxin-like protein